MRSSPLRLTAFSRLATAALLACVLATPALAQFGGLKKKIKRTTGQEETRATAQASDPTPAQGGSVALTADVVNQLITGLKAGQAERQAAMKEDTPYGRYQKAKQAYAEAVPKCEAGRQAWVQKGDSKQLDKSNALIEKSLKAQEKGDTKLMQIYQDSLSLLQGGPSCLVKQPEQPDGYYELEREVDVRALRVAVKASGLSGGEFAMAQERAMSILRTGAPSDVSQSEKTAVLDKKSELQPLLWPEEKPAVAAAKPVAQPAPAPAPAAPQADPQMTAASSSMTNCMVKNSQDHQKELEALSKRAQAAQQAGNQAALMALADTLQQIQMAGCMKR